MLSDKTAKIMAMDMRMEISKFQIKAASLKPVNVKIRATPYLTQMKRSRKLECKQYDDSIKNIGGIDDEHMGGNGKRRRYGIYGEEYIRGFHYQKHGEKGSGKTPAVDFGEEIMSVETVGHRDDFPYNS